MLLIPIVSLANESMIKVCLASAYTLQKNYHVNHGSYADNIQQLSWGNTDCIKNFEPSITKATQSQFEVHMSSKSSKWTIDQNKNMVKIN